MRVSTPNLFSTRTEIVCRINSGNQKPAFRAGTAGDLPALRQSLGSRQSVTTTLATRPSLGNRFIAGAKVAIGQTRVNRHFRCDAGGPSGLEAAKRTDCWPFQSPQL